MKLNSSNTFLLATCIETCLLAVSPMVIGANDQTISSEVSGIRIAVAHTSEYDSSNSVLIRYTITNRSSRPIKVVHGTDIYHDFSINLIAPDGTPSQQFSLVSDIWRGSTATLNPGDSEQGGIDLALVYPLTVTGEYRCSITKRVYEEDATVIRRTSRDPPGKPIELTSPEFRFDVLSIDPTFVSPFAPKQAQGKAPHMSTPANDIVTPPLNVSRQLKTAFSLGRTATSLLTPWLGWIFVVVSAIGLLCLRLKGKRKKGDDS